MTQGPQRFDWVARRFTREEFPVEILLTPLRWADGLMIVSRDNGGMVRTVRLRRPIELNTFLVSSLAHQPARSLEALLLAAPKPRWQATSWIDCFIGANPEKSAKLAKRTKAQIRKSLESKLIR
jgi:hypothetical protein